MSQWQQCKCKTKFQEQHLQKQSHVTTRIRRKVKWFCMFLHAFGSQCRKFSAYSATFPWGSSHHGVVHCHHHRPHPQTDGKKVDDAFRAVNPNFVRLSTWHVHHAHHHRRVHTLVKKNDRWSVWCPSRTLSGHVHSKKVSPKTSSFIILICQKKMVGQCLGAACFGLRTALLFVHLTHSRLHGLRQQGLSGLPTALLDVCLHHQG